MEFVSIGIRIGFLLAIILFLWDTFSAMASLLYTEVWENVT